MLLYYDREQPLSNIHLDVLNEDMVSWDFRRIERDRIKENLKSAYYEVTMSWTECTEENYPNDSIIDRVVVRYWISGEGPYYSLFRDCPYGWGTLCKMERSEYYILPE